MADLIMGKSNKTLLASLLASTINLNNNNNLKHYFFILSMMTIVFNFIELLENNFKHSLFYK